MCFKDIKAEQLISDHIYRTQNINDFKLLECHIPSAQRVPEPDPLPGISFNTRPDPIQF